MAGDHPLLAGLVHGSPPGGSPLRHVRRVPARQPSPASWPNWVQQDMRAALGAVAGVLSPWPHQGATAELAWSGESVVIATGTASGKSLGYQLPMLSAVLADDRARALYLAPTKALAADQLRTIAALGLSGSPVSGPPPWTAIPPCTNGIGCAGTPTCCCPPGHVAPVDAAPARPPGLLLAPAAVRRHRRMPLLPRDVRLPRVAGAAPSAPDLRGPGIRTRVPPPPPPPPRPRIRVRPQRVWSASRCGLSRRIRRRAARGPSPCGSRR